MSGCRLSLPCAVPVKIMAGHSLAVAHLSSTTHPFHAPSVTDDSTPSYQEYCDFFGHTPEEAWSKNFYLKEICTNPGTITSSCYVGVESCAPTAARLPTPA